MAVSTVDLPAAVSRQETIHDSDEVLAMPDIPLREQEDIIRVNVLGMDWDLGAVIYEPREPEKVACGADGKKAGIFLLHGGSGDFKTMDAVARLAAGKFGFRVLSGTFPGRFYFPDPGRDWPDDTIHEDGSVRTPIWKQGEMIGRDEYEVKKDTSMRPRYGTRTVARAKPGTNFYNRMASWPAAFEEGMKEAMRRHLPEGEFSIYGEGHSTGGPFVSMLSQRVPNFAGVVATEHTPFGHVGAMRDNWSGSLGKVSGFDRVSTKDAARHDPFNELYIRTWRDLARYAGPEALGQQGPAALMQLPMLMEEIFDSWQRAKLRPQFKVEYVITHNITASLTEAAQVSAKRLRMNREETDALIERYVGYPRELRGPNARPLPPFLFVITKDSRDHSPEVYREVILPAFNAMEPAPRTHLTHFGAGVHSFWKAEEGLPLGVAPAAIKLWNEAIVGGYFVV
jgi:hypothetical protein